MAGPMADVITNSNYRLRGEIVSFGKQGISIKHPAIRQKAVILSSEIKAIYFIEESTPDMRVRDKIFMSDQYQDIIPCNISAISQAHIYYRDILGNERSVPRSQTAGVRLNTLREKDFWQEPLVFDNSWIYLQGENDYRSRSCQKLLNAFKPNIQGNKYQYRPNKYPIWIALYKNIDLDPSSFTFRITLSMVGGKHRSGIVFCFGGKETVPFRSNSSSKLNRLMLSITPDKCILLREHKDGISVLGEINIPSTALAKEVKIKLISSKHEGTKQIYELLVGDLPPKLMTDPIPSDQPLQGDAFGLQMEGRVNMTISQLTLSSINLSSKTISKNGPLKNDLVLTKEEDAIPCSIKEFNKKTGILKLTLNKDYPDIPKELSIHSKYLDTILFAEPSSNLKPVSQSAKHNVLMKDGARLHGVILNMDSRNIVLLHPLLGQVPLPLKNIARVEYLNPAQPSRSKP